MSRVRSRSRTFSVEGRFPDVAGATSQFDEHEQTPSSRFMLILPLTLGILLQWCLFVCHQSNDSGSRYDFFCQSVSDSIPKFLIHSSYLNTRFACFDRSHHTIRCLFDSSRNCSLSSGARFSRCKSDLTTIFPMADSRGAWEQSGRPVLLDACHLPLDSCVIPTSTASRKFQESRRFWTFTLSGGSQPASQMAHSGRKIPSISWHFSVVSESSVRFGKSSAREVLRCRGL